ncbi:3'-5' exonuclease-like [Carex rostrata]
MGIFYDDTNSTYIVRAVNDEIRATVTNSGEVVSDWIDDILRIHHRRLDRLIVGLDVEYWRPINLDGTYGWKAVALLQLCVGRRCLIFQLHCSDFIPDKLLDFLRDDRFKFVGVGINGDAENLKQRNGIEVGHVMDLRHLAAEHMERPAIRQWGLKKLAYKIMRVQIQRPKMVILGNWGKRVLSKKQIEYATIDAFVSFEIGRMIYAGEI